MKLRFVVIISADVEWEAVTNILSGIDFNVSPLGEWFIYPLDIINQSQDVIFFHGGWGKIAAAASAQYVIDHWSPDLLINLGTCGGFEGEVERGEIVLVDRTIVYDIIEQMGDYESHIAHYSMDIDLSWLSEPYPMQVKKTLIVSADRDILPEDIPQLKKRFKAAVGDWESGAIAYVAARNRVKLLILRGVTDLVGNQGGEVYGNISLFKTATYEIMVRLIKSIPDWLSSIHFD